MVSTVHQMTRRSRSRTPSRVATPQVKAARPKSKHSSKKRGPTTRGRSKTPTRITASTPKPKSTTSSKSTPARKTPSAAKESKKRKSIVNQESDDDDDIDFPVAKKSKSPKGSATPSTSKAIGRPKKSLTLDDLESSPDSKSVRRSRRLREQARNSILEESATKRKTSKESRDLSINNGDINQSQNETLNETQQSGKWGWFSCAIM